jgi:hypothetical protein
MSLLPHALAAERTLDKMPIYLRILPHRLRRHALRHCTQPVVLVIAIILFLVVLPLLLRDQIDAASRGINGIYDLDPNYKYIVSAKPSNPWLELSLTYRREVLTDFTPYMAEPGTGCIDRSRYRFEFARLVGLHPYRHDLSRPHVLLVGDATDLGIAIWRRLNESKIDVAHTGCQHSVDWASGDAGILIERVNLTRAILACPMTLPKFARTDGTASARRTHSTFLRGFGRVMLRRGVPFVYVASGPIEKDHVALVAEFGGKVVQTPLLLSDNNILGQTVRECRKAGQSWVEVSEDAEVSSLTVEDVAEYVLKGSIPDRAELLGGETANLRRTIAKMAGECNVSFRNSPRKPEPSTENWTRVLLEPKPKALSDFMQRDFPLKKGTPPYLSIVVVGRHDNFSGGFETRTQNFIDSIGRGLERAPLADIELVFVDYATPKDRTPLHETFTHPPQLKGITRYIQVPVEKHELLQAKYDSRLGFFEYIVKNIGLRRARGRFILSTNPDNLFPSTLFELIAIQDFHEGVLYRSVRWDTRDHTFDNATVAELWQAMGEPWRLKEFDVKVRCSVGDNRFTVSDSLKKFLDQAYPCGGGDFLLASRKLWDTVWAFNEVPSNPNVDAVFLAKFMKLLPGYARFFIHPLNMHQRHEKKNVQRPAVKDLDIVMEEVACVGESKTLGNNWDTHRWGQDGEVYDEIQM